MKLTVIGGGGFRVPLIHAAILGRPELGIDELCLFDLDPDRLSVIGSVLQAGGRPGPTDGRPRVTAATDLPTALAGADVVFAAIRVGGAAGRVADERRALDRGILGQETVGAGGLAFGLRTLPVMLELAEAVLRLAPQAWLINFTNPAGLITQGLQTVLGERVIGICDSPVGLVGRAAVALGVDPALAVPDYAGINHLGWLRRLDVAGRDRLPELLADPDRLASFEEGRLFGPDLPRALGALPNEYLAYYYDHRGLTRTLTATTTRGEFLLAEQDAFFAAAGADPAAAAELWRATRDRREASYLAETRADGQQRDQADLAGGGYQHVALDLIDSLCRGVDRTLIVNCRNGSTFPQLPPDCVIEVPCRISGAGARPLPAEPLSLHQLGLVASVRAAELAILDAVRSGRRSDALRAFVIHPLVGSPAVARSLLADVLARYPEVAARMT